MSSVAGARSGDIPAGGIAGGVGAAGGGGGGLGGGVRVGEGGGGHRLSEKEERTINNYVLHLVYKCVQCIFQSRVGIKQQTTSKSTVPDWFNLSIRDLPDVQLEIKTRMSSASSDRGSGPAGAVPCLKTPVCVEVMLKTNDGDIMMLEYWWLTSRSVAMTTVRSSGVVYTYSETLIKSLLTLSRATPAYRLSRRQAPHGGDYQVSCEIKLEEPRISPADQYKMEIVGTVPVPRGQVVLNLAYKPHPHLSARRIGVVDLTRDLKIDHFDIAGTSPRTPPALASSPRYPPLSWQPDTTTTTNTDMGSYATVAGRAKDGVRTKRAAFGPSPLSEDRPRGDLAEESGGAGGVPGIGAGSMAGGAGIHLLGGDDDIPFASLLVQCGNGEGVEGGVRSGGGMRGEAGGIGERKRFNEGTNDRTGEHQSCAPTVNDTNTVVGQQTKTVAVEGQSVREGGVREGVGREEEFILLELKVPFGGQEEDLGRFYLDCQTAPALSMFECRPGGVAGGVALAEGVTRGVGGGRGSDGVGIQDTLSSITEQIALFEASALDFNLFVNSLEDYQ